MSEASGSLPSAFQTLPLALTLPSLSFTSCKETCVQLPDSHVYGALAITSSPLYNSTSFFAGETCSFKPPTPLSPTPKAGKRRPLLVPKILEEAETLLLTVGPKSRPKGSSGAPGN